MCSAKHQLPALAGSVVVIEPSPIHLTNEIVGRAIREYRVMARASLATQAIRSFIVDSNSVVVPAVCPEHRTQLLLVCLIAGQPTSAAKSKNKE